MCACAREGREWGVAYWVVVVGRVVPSSLTCAREPLRLICRRAPQPETDEEIPAASTNPPPLHTLSLSFLQMGARHEFSARPVLLECTCTCGPLPPVPVPHGAAGRS